MNFKMPGKVYKTAMSTLSTSHMLIAAGTEDVQVRLCDIASGAFAHTLSGHRGVSVFSFQRPTNCFLYYYLCYVFLTTSVNLYFESSYFTVNLIIVKILSKMARRWEKYSGN